MRKERLSERSGLILCEWLGQVGDYRHSGYRRQQLFGTIPTREVNSCWITLIRVNFSGDGLLLPEPEVDRFCVAAFEQPPLADVRNTFENHSDTEKDFSLVPQKENWGENSFFHRLICQRVQAAGFLSPRRRKLSGSEHVAQWGVPSGLTGVRFPLLVTCHSIVGPHFSQKAISTCCFGDLLQA